LLHSSALYSLLADSQFVLFLVLHKNVKTLSHLLGNKVLRQFVTPTEGFVILLNLINRDQISGDTGNIVGIKEKQFE
jgi:hypothetical protein